MQSPVKLTRSRQGLIVNGHFDYVSLANVADLVFFTGTLDDANVLCIADLRAESVRIGESRFEGRMRLSDTCEVWFRDHLLSAGRYVVVQGESALGCMTRYQRSWFQLLVGESYLARIDHLRRVRLPPRCTEELAQRNELAQLRDYALRLLDEATTPGGIDALSRLTTTMKLRISWLAQSTAAALRGIDDVAANELLHLKRQPTADDRIIRELSGQPFVVHQRQILAGARAYAPKVAT
jgi:alkylation response protein AidB-like acyl-CoA dehydrogenase